MRHMQYLLSNVDRCMNRICFLLNRYLFDISIILSSFANEYRICTQNEPNNEQ